MYIGFARFNVKKGKEKIALKHMKHHLEFSRKCSGFIHGFIAKSRARQREYIVIEEYETQNDYNNMKALLRAEAKKHKKEFFDFFHALETKPLMSMYEKLEFTKTKISPAYKRLLKKFHERKIVGKNKGKKKLFKKKKVSGRKKKK